MSNSTPDGSPRSFPPGFTWGVATSAYQIEGAWDADGKGPSIWDTYSHTPGNVADGDTGDVACDHYNRYRDDVAMMSDELGVGAYRFSVAWTRVQPDGVTVEPRGLDFYDRLVDELAARDIAPFVTLYHWDLPQALQDRGGWGDRDIAERFRDYAMLVHERLGDRVQHWATHNEPWVVSFVGHFVGRMAPGLRDPELALRTVHHLLLAHGDAVAAMRSARADADYGIVLNMSHAYPADEQSADAVRRVDGLHQRVFLEPLVRGAYPADVLEDVRHVTDFGFVQDGDLARISQPLDWLGLNYYNPVHVSSSPGAEPGMMPGLRDVKIHDPAPPLTEMGWGQDPDSLRLMLERLSRENPGLPIYITENGSAWADVVDAGGEVHDPERVGYLLGHLGAAADAIAAGVDLRGYFAWSLMDNFEWAHGYRPRFGIVHVDFGTQKRTVKDSGKTYSAVVRSNQLPHPSR